MESELRGNGGGTTENSDHQEHHAQGQQVQLTPSQLRLRQMIAMQHAQQESLAAAAADAGGVGQYGSIEPSPPGGQGGGGTAEPPPAQSRPVMGPSGIVMRSGGNGNGRGDNSLHYQTYTSQPAPPVIPADMSPPSGAGPTTSGIVNAGEPQSGVGMGRIYYQTPHLYQVGEGHRGGVPPISPEAAVAPAAPVVDAAHPGPAGSTAPYYDDAAPPAQEYYQRLQQPQAQNPAPPALYDPMANATQDPPLDVHQHTEYLQHQFHYGNPDASMSHHHHQSSSFLMRFCRSCCCLCRPLASCIAALLHAENLHRSFCFGAIDGMLTGSGITAACAGMGKFSPLGELYKPRDHFAVVALCLAACASDGICMALGHVWSTFVIHASNASERKLERENFVNNRAGAKGRLVDALLGRGMLKIDAMSVADTLEGYPDIFVSALVGDSGYALGDGGDAERLAGMGGPTGEAPNGTIDVHGHGEGGGHANQIGSGGVLGLAQGSGPGFHHGLLNPEDGEYGHGHYPPPLHDHQHDRTGKGSQRVGLGRLPAFQSHGQLDEFYDDPDALGMRIAVGESRNEGFVMMISFTMFSLLPSLIHVLVLMLGVGGGNIDDNMDYSDLGKNNIAVGVSAASVTVSITSLVMLLLGIWKSKFFDSSWIVFGVETVLVLLLAILSAYSIGTGLAALIQKLD